MISHFYVFFKKNLALSLTLSAILIVLYSFVPALNLQLKYLFIILFFFLFTLFAHYIVLKLTFKKINKFFNYFMIATMVKLIVYCGIIIVYLFNFRENAKPFAIVFLVSYIGYTFIEAASLQKFVKKK